MKCQHLPTILVTVTLGAGIATSYGTPIAADYGQRLAALEQKVDRNSDKLSRLGTTPKDDPRPAALGDTYVVQRGDSLSKIGRKYGVSTAALVRANRLPSANKIGIGQRLTIPGRNVAASPPRQAPTPARPVSPKAPPAASTHEVQKGETLYSIARRHGVSVRELQANNGISDPTMIWGGQILRIPGGVAPAQVAKNNVSGYSVPNYPSGYRSQAAGSKEGGHTVVRGETLSKIARAHGTTARALQTANGISDPRKLRIGQTLQIPSRTGNSPSPAQTKAVATYRAPAPPKPATAPVSRPAQDLGDDEYLGYYVYAGDTVESIASTIGTDPALLRQINDVPSGSQFETGQQILVPASAIFDS